MSDVKWTPGRIKEAIAELEKRPCLCVSCSFCNGNGFMRGETGDYPETDFDSCQECGGSGIVERCDRCYELGELDYDLEEAEAALSKARGDSK